ncbi:Checkpoint protein hus1 [Spiromyces aspiralis]|uniref:Checkpoint protein hus1 n=1 Tax=Spiromyces aspiralis TaxID=68401 RepID=A0ACC1HWY0_9FUNG|nr:Checkpoint protein hus1 [Spiromyces aspiralis]
MDSIREPLVPEAQVHIMSPPLNNLRSMAERLRTIGDTVAISANMSGEFTLKVATELVEIETYFRGLDNPEFDTTSQSQTHQTTDPAVERFRQNPSLFATGVIDIKNFIRFLHSYHVAPTNIVCCIIESHAVIFYVYIGSTLTSNNQAQQGADQTCGALTYYIPVRLS